jgi:hypothetical protein
MTFKQMSYDVQADELLPRGDRRIWNLVMRDAGGEATVRERQRGKRLWLVPIDARPETWEAQTNNGRCGTQAAYKTQPSSETSPPALRTYSK